jgi:hypothetical protein
MGKKKNLPEIDQELIIDLVGIKRNTGPNTPRNNSNKDQPDTKSMTPKDKTKFLD